ncbi:MAG TPA: type I restriction endonuclease subunit R [Bacteroidales bacterium]|nr:type I restriction endonuclease subunit R [Bacteroidales bacterium]
MPTNFTEFTRVQIPALLHLERLGYHFIPCSQLPHYGLDRRSNILNDILKDALLRLNPNLRETEITEKINELNRIADYDDLGREFYKKLTDTSNIRLIDFEHPENNTWHCTIELECENQTTYNHFRPDITCFVNGLPLVHIEVKKPQNREGMLAERERMNDRMQQRDFRRFLNITQLMIFSNNEEYDTDCRVPVQGAFYASISKGKIFFNVFREANQRYYETLQLIETDPKREQEILTSLGKSVLVSLPEYQSNKSATTPTNRLLSSLLAKERLLYFLNYGFAYVNTTKKDKDGNEYSCLEKHVMRYPQFFANRAICANLDKGINSGTIWHTQGSGKTALSYFAVKILTDYFARRNTVARFYFIVDRIALMEQAMREFTARGLKVFTAQSRKELMKDFEQNVTMRGTDGQPEIMVVNIQKFDEQKEKLEVKYNTNIQRIFFVDEAHRSYSFGSVSLANLMNSDEKAVKIALTGTPLLKSECETWRIFGHYYDKYYYDKSIADGFTLRLMREDIETDYKDKLLQIIKNEFPEDIEVKKKDVSKDMIIESDNYVHTLIEFVTRDLIRFRKDNDDQSVAGMLVCETNPQARKVKRMFDEYQSTQPHPLRAELILHDEGDAETRKSITDNFKDATDIDILIVNQMLLTGFDAHRLKRLYLTRKMQGHDLLQALTRVNRPYKDFRYGYVIDFAGIKDNFEEANDQYIRELNSCDPDNGTADDVGEPRQLLGDAVMEHKEDIIAKLQDIRQAIFAYDCGNAENLRKQLEEENIPKENLYELRNALEEAKALTNQIRTFGDEELKKKLADMEASNSNFSNLLAVVSDRIARINLKEQMEHSEDVHGMVNYILSEMEYQFVSKGKGELSFLWDNEMQEKLRQVVEEFENNFDHEEQDFKKLLESFRKYYREKGFKPLSRQEIKEKIGYLDEVMKVIRDINHRNILLKHKFHDDERFVRVYKRIDEANRKRKMYEPFIISKVETDRVDALNKIREQVDDILYHDNNAIRNEGYFSGLVMSRVSNTLKTMNLVSMNAPAATIKQTMHDMQEIHRLIVMESTNQYKQYKFKTA